MAKLEIGSGGENPDYSFECPGCKCYHGIWIEPNHNPLTKAAWQFDGNLDSPTITPSLLTKYDGGGTCHLFITDGKIQYLSDCTHELRGQTIEMTDAG